MYCATAASYVLRIRIQEYDCLDVREAMHDEQLRADVFSIGLTNSTTYNCGLGHMATRCAARRPSYRISSDISIGQTMYPGLYVYAQCV